VRIRVAEGELVPRTVMSYLVKPMRDQIAKAFKGR
jgi:hypothetical protein